MSKADKRLQRAKNNPRGWHFEDLRTLYETFGFSVRTAKGSHYVASHPKVRRRPTFKYSSQELSAEYVKEAVEAIEELLNAEGENDEDE